MKHKKLIISSIVIALAISVWALTPVKTTMGGMYMIEVPTGVDDLTRTADLVIIGTYLSETTQYTGDEDVHLRSVVTVNVDEILKGTYDYQTLEVNDVGSGTSYKNGYRVEIISMTGITYEDDEKMIMFLDWDEGNYLGDGYYLVASYYGKYTINGTDANYVIEERSTTVQEVRDQIKQSLP